jgi:hypothetical protein
MDALKALYNETFETLQKLKSEQLAMAARQQRDNQSRCVALSVTNTEAALWALRDAIDPAKLLE